MVVLRAETKRYAGGCRNIGIDYPLDCEYYYFMDSDDYLYSITSLEKIYNAAKDLKNDIILFNWARQFNNSIKTYNFNSFEQIIKSYKLLNNNWNAAWSRCVKAKLIQKFLEHCMFGEDTYQFVKLLEVNPVIKQISDIIYVYRNNPNGCINSSSYIRDKTSDIFYNAITHLMWETQNQNVKLSIRNRLDVDNKLTPLTDIKTNKSAYKNIIPKILYMIWFGKKPKYVDYIVSIYQQVNPDF